MNAQKEELPEEHSTLVHDGTLGRVDAGCCIVQEVSELRALVIYGDEWAALDERGPSPGLVWKQQIPASA